MIHRGHLVRAESLLQVVVAVQVTPVIARGRRQGQARGGDALVVPPAARTGHVPLAHEIGSTVGAMSVQIFKFFAIDFVAAGTSGMRDKSGASVKHPAVDLEPHVVAAAAVPLKLKTFHNFSCLASQVLAIQELESLPAQMGTSSIAFVQHSVSASK